MKKIVWSIKEIVQILMDRQKNAFDGNILVSGDRGNGKSTIISKIFYRFPTFNPWKHQVYSREEVIKLLRNEKYGLCFDDEAINSGYKRDFQNKSQQELIKMVTMYRDNFNIYASAIPNFFSLDKDLRDLIFIHLHVIERGIAVVHMPLQGRLYSQDRWDTKNNSKIEQSWNKRMMKNPNFKPPYYRLSTFRGYLLFKDLTPKQKALYLDVKATKRRELYGEEDVVEEKLSFNDRVYKLLLERKLTKDGLQQLCLLEGKKYSAVSTSLNRMLTDDGIQETLTDFLQSKKNRVYHNKKVLDKLNLIGNSP